MQKSSSYDFFEAANLINQFLLFFTYKSLISRNMLEVSLTALVVHFRNREVIRHLVKSNFSGIALYGHNHVLGHVSKVSVGFAVVLNKKSTTPRFLASLLIKARGLPTWDTSDLNPGIWPVYPCVKSRRLSAMTSRCQI